MVQKSLKKNAVLNFLRSFMNIAFPIISFPYASRILLPVGIGKVNFANSLIEYFDLIAGLGVVIYAAREAARIRDNQFELNKFSREMLLINAASTLLSCALFAAALFFVPKFSEYQTLLVVCATKILLCSINMEWLYQSQEEYGYITMRQAFFQVISLAMLFLLVKGPDDYVRYAFIGVFSNVGSNVCNLIYARRFINIFEKTAIQIKKHLRPVFTFFGLACASKIHSAMDVVMLGFIAGDIAVGHYSAASKIRRLVIQLIDFVLGTLMPRNSYYLENNKIDEYNDIVRKSAGIAFFFSVPATAGLIAISRPIVILFSGEEYLPAIPIMRVMSPIVIVFTLTSFLNHVVLTPHRKERYILYAQIIGCVLNVALNIPLIKLWGAWGAGLATFFVETAISITMCASSIPYIKFALRYMATIFLKSLLGSALMFASIYFLLPCLHSELLQIVLGICTGVFVYGGAELLLKNDTALWLWKIITEKIRKSP